MRFLKAQRTGKYITDIVSKMVTVAGYVACFYLSYLMVAAIAGTVHELAGKKTSAQISQTFGADININVPDLIKYAQTAAESCNKIVQAGNNWAVKIGILLSFMGLVAIWSSIAYAKKTRRLRRETIRRCEGRIKELETARDPKRSSSGLGPAGDTNPEDV